MATGAGGKTLFTRQSSGLVREVSVVNALFFNTAAFVGPGVGWYPVFYALAGVPVGVAASFTTYGWAAIIVGAFAVALALIFASLTSLMPRSGGDYVFTSRIVPKIGPFLGWLESWTLVFASLAIIAFEVPVFVRNLQITGRIIGIGTGIGFFQNANDWFAEEPGYVTGIPGFIAAVLVLLLVAAIVFQSTRRFHRIVTTLALMGLIAGVLMFVLGFTVVNPATFAANLPQYTNGLTLDQLAQAGADNHLTTTGGLNLDPTVFSFMLGILLLQYIGFQYSAYISGEIRGNVRRGTLIALLGALAIAVFMNSAYTDWLAARFGINAQIAWGGSYWGFFSNPPLPLGQPNSMPLMGVITVPGLWPVWTLISLGVTVFPFLLCPVYIIFLSRVQLAWSLDRQVPEWFGRVSDRLHSPANAIFAALAVAAVFAFLQNFAFLKAIGLGALAPSADPLLDGKLNLVSTLWFSILLAGLTWIMPGVNALLIRWTRPDLVKDAPFRTWLPVLGAIWVVFAVILYWFAGIKPIVDAVAGALAPGATETALGYLNRTGISFTLIFFVAGAVIYVVRSLANRAAGLDTSLIYKELPPD